MDEQLYRAFAELEDQHWWFTARRRILGALISRWVPVGASIVDVGCGTGGFISDLQARYEVRGVDPSLSALEYCRRRGLNAVHAGGAGDVTSWGGLPVDAVTLLDVIEHLDDDVGALRAARAAVRPGGHVIVTVPAYQWMWSKHDVLNHHRRRYTAQRLREAHAAAGLRPVQLGYFNTLLFPVAVLQRALVRIRRGTSTLSLPPRPLNRALRAVFSLEAGVVADIGGTFPFGLSAFCVSVPDGIPHGP